MLNSIRLSRSLRFGAALLALTAAAGCRDTTGADDEPEIAAVRFTIGTQTVTISDNGTQTGTATLVLNTATPIVAVALRANGQEETLVTAADFQLRVQPVTTNVTFDRTAWNAGTLRRTSSGTATVRISFFHMGENHEDFGPFNLTLN